MALSGTREGPGGPPALPTDIWDHICSYLSKPSLFQLRLASRSLSDVARHWAYRSLRLEAFGTSAERFAEVARRPELRGLVRELTIDSWPGPSGDDYNPKEEYEEPDAFINNLPYLRVFGGLTALHLRFNNFCRFSRRCRCPETRGMRYRMLDTVCHCVAGLWTRERQAAMDKEMQKDMGALGWEPRYPHPGEDTSLPSGGLMHLRELTIANLADYDEPRLSMAWDKVLAAPGLVDVKLLVSCQCINNSHESTQMLKGRHEFCDNLPLSYLSPAVTSKLRVLSLFYRENWGWFPKVDLRGVELPQLRVLALGNYVFSHEWQIDWFATLGTANASGGLGELYLDDCAILSSALQYGPLSSDEPGYPIREIALGATYDLESYEFPLRWHHVLLRWAESMRGLRVLEMGHGNWRDNPCDTYKALALDDEFAGVEKETREYRACHNLHRDFACPAPLINPCFREECYRGEREAVWRAGRHLHGTGMHCARPYRMQYIEYDGSLDPEHLPTVYSDYPGSSDVAFEPEEGTEDKDDAAYGVLMAAVETRAGRWLEGLSTRDT